MGCDSTGGRLLRWAKYALLAMTPGKCNFDLTHPATYAIIELPLVGCPPQPARGILFILHPNPQCTPMELAQAGAGEPGAGRSERQMSCQRIARGRKIVLKSRLNPASTFQAASKNTVQVSVLKQPKHALPLQPVKVEPRDGEAVNVTIE